MIKGPQIKYFLAFFVLYCLVVFVMAFRHNPHFQTINLDSWPTPVKMPYTHPVQFSKPGAPVTAPVFEYRGNNKRQGWVTVDRQPKSLTEVWKTEPLNIGVHKAMKSVPAVDASGVYVGSDSGWFFKFDHQGKKVWSYFASSATKGFHATAVLDENFVYVGAYNGIMYCLRKENGELVWAHQLGGFIGSSALLTKNFLYVGVETEKDGFLAKLDARNGEIVWRGTFTGAPVHSSPALDEKSGTVVIANIFGSVSAIEEETGNYSMILQTGDAIRSTASIANGVAFITSYDHWIYALDITTKKVVWKKEYKESLLSSVTIDQDSNIGYIATTSSLFAFSLQDGHSLWQNDFPANPTAGTPVLLKGKTDSSLLIACGGDSLCVVNAKNGKSIVRKKMNGTLNSMPSVFDNKIYVSLQEKAGLQVFSY
ncbi:PQQ-binding-like beta-propeller repeat protein [Bdellovibrio sp. NC01]|uniref:outer membrane protein assembly factor BamB family protein n=1 Tax=Bdellovibrio sp. NC01 TaxID=2220073 RepID=UPI00143D13FF|nr:PQQ-binding-like beta-propeller repeat protein [Bdellovibrio sp. NC01]